MFLSSTTFNDEIALKQGNSQREILAASPQVEEGK